jgi:hypothetical protein
LRPLIGGDLVPSVPDSAYQPHNICYPDSLRQVLINSA